MKPSVLLSSLLLCVSFSFAFAQVPPLDWAIAAGGTGAEQINGIAVDASGNVYTTGYFSGNADFNPAENMYTTLNSVGGRDIFIQKVDASGNLVWAQSLGSTNDETGYDLDVDASGNVYITGFFAGATDFDPSAFTQTIISPVSGSDIFILKLTANGDFGWVKTIGGFYSDAGRDIALDTNNNIFVTGFFQGTVDFDPSSTATSNLSAAFFDAFALKLNANGSFAWATKFGGSDINNFDSGQCIAIDNNNNVLIGGDYTGTVDFDPSPTAAVNKTAWDSVGDKFYVKLTNTGEFVWVYTIQGTVLNDHTSALDADANGNVYLAGNFTGSVDTDPSFPGGTLAGGSSVDFFVVKLSAAGDYVWSQAFLGAANNEAHALAVDRTNQAIYVSGNFTGTVDFEPSDEGTYDLTSNGSSDAFVVKLDAAGYYLFATQIGGSGTDGNYAIAADHVTPYLSGVFTSTVDFDPSPSTTKNITSTGGNDVFLVKFKGLPTSLFDSPSATTTIELFPNPSNGQITLSTTKELSDAVITVQDASGTVVLQQKHIHGTRFPIDLTTLKNGLYLLEIRDDHYQDRVKIIKN